MASKARTNKPRQKAEEEKEPTGSGVSTKFRKQVEDMLSTADLDSTTLVSLDAALMTYAAKSHLRRQCEKKMTGAHRLMGGKKYAKAREAFLRAKTVLLSTLGSAEPAVSDADHSLGYICFQMAKKLARTGQENITRGELMSASITHLEYALDLRKYNDGATSRRTGLTLDLLSIVQLHAERFREAAFCAQQAQHVWLDVEGFGHLHMAESLCAQARALLSLKEHSKAAAVYKKAVSARQQIVERYVKMRCIDVTGDISAGDAPKIVEKSHQDTKKHKTLLAQTYHFYGVALHCAGRYDQALDQMKQGYKIRLGLIGLKPPLPDGKRDPIPHALLVEIQHDMGKCHLRKRDHLQASKHFRIALSMQLELLDADDIKNKNAVNELAAKLMHSLGLSLSHRDGMEEGIPVLSRAAEIQSTLHLFKQEVLSLRALANIYALDKDSYQDALDVLKNALQVQYDLYPKPHKEQANTLASIGYTYCRMRHYKQALKQYQRGLDIIGKTEGYRSKVYGEMLYDLAHIHINLHEMANARSLGAQAKAVLAAACSSPKTADPALLARVEGFLSALGAPS